MGAAEQWIPSYIGAKLWYRSWPAVSHISNLTVASFTANVCEKNAAPIKLTLYKPQDKTGFSSSHVTEEDLREAKSVISLLQSEEMEVGFSNDDFEGELTSLALRLLCAIVAISSKEADSAEEEYKKNSESLHNFKWAGPSPRPSLCPSSVGPFDTSNCFLRSHDWIWEIYRGKDNKDDDDDDEDPEEVVEEDVYFFTLLKKKSINGSRINRKMGCGGGAWQSEDAAKKVPPEKSNARRLGFKKRFRYENKGSKHDGPWIMHEYSLDPYLLGSHQVNDYVSGRMLMYWGRRRRSAKKKKNN
uniref:NAC transcription factor 97 n=1 Tax=Litchi chinensis TaxID=151069 RepID=A0A8K1MBH5_LITCN|nr:NAC transcription factor 97 [Litchi chinensis]